MSLSSMMTQTASTTRFGAIASGKRGTLAANLTNLKITPIMLPDSRSASATVVRRALGLESSAVQIFEAYTESHTHTDSGVEVTQMPDIVANDRIVIGSITYNVRMVERQPATSSFGATMLLHLIEDRLE